MITPATGLVGGNLSAVGPRAFNRPPSKNPAAFGIDLHVDDSDGVRIEGEELGFHVVVVATDDREWMDRVLQAASELHRRSAGP